MRITVTVPDQIGRDAEQMAREEGTSVSAFYADAIERWIRELRRQRAVGRVRGLIGASEVAPGASEELSRTRRASDRMFG